MKYLFIILCFLAPLHAEIITSNFAFGGGIPFVGSTSIDGVDIELTTTNTESFGATAFRDDTSANIAFVTLQFSSNVQFFSVNVSRVASNEFITNFNLGTPSALDGDLIDIDNRITTSRNDDFGSGNIIFSDINTDTISFEIDAPGALAVNEFSFEIAAVPEPSTYFILFFLSVICVLKFRGNSFLLKKEL
ncbi:hypothetical protein [Candidatus Uabimicrobium sp. HlEnr_7]|uniref:hypothetical protein n=1 Tax=Candidatus Uabimicrobium helgolandensis TaxID=3095367 RepID=UPI003556DC66